jgi:hypothetical protein
MVWEEMGDYAVLWKNGKMRRLGEKRRFAEDPRLDRLSVFEYGYSSESVPMLLKNGVVQRVGGGALSEAYSDYISSDTFFGARAKSIFVCDKDVYIFGWHEIRERPENTINYLHVATMWTNGKGMFLGDVKGHSEAHSAFVLDGNVCIAGFVENSLGKSVATLWKNDESMSLSDGNYNAVALSVFVSGNDVYVAGYEESAKGKTVATLWKNGKARRLSNGTRNATACSVSVSGKDVYVAVNEHYENRKTTIRLWKNGESQRLRGDDSSIEWRCVDGEWKRVCRKYSNAKASSLFVLNGDVYIAGTEVIDYYIGHCYTCARLWKNGVLQLLETQHDTEAHSVFISGKNVYVAGVERIIHHK